MSDEINSLTDDRAEQALLLLFDLVPAESWQGGKPTVSEVDGLVEQIADVAPELRPSLDAALTRPGDLARTVLLELSGDPTLRPYVEMAVARSSMPHLFTGLEISGAVALILFVAKIRRIHAGPVDIFFDNAKDAAKLVEKTTQLVKRLNP